MTGARYNVYVCSVNANLGCEKKCFEPTAVAVIPNEMQSA